MNVCTFVGRTGKDAESKDVNGKTVTNFSIAVNRTTKDSEGNYLSDWFNVEVWGKSAEYASKITKGSLVSVSGSIQINKSEKDGKTTQFIKLVANSVNCIVKGGEQAQKLNNSTSKQTQPTNSRFDDFEDDIPPF